MFLIPDYRGFLVPANRNRYPIWVLHVNEKKVTKNFLVAVITSHLNYLLGIFGIKEIKRIEKILFRRGG